jgi:hypothetical protein
MVTAAASPPYSTDILHGVLDLYSSCVPCEMSTYSSDGGETYYFDIESRVGDEEMQAQGELTTDVPARLINHADVPPGDGAHTAAASSAPRPHTSNGLQYSTFAQSRDEHSPYEDDDLDIPAIPAIPARFLDSGHTATITSSPAPSTSERARSKPAARDADATPELRVERPKTSAGDIPGSNKRTLSQKPVPSPNHARTIGSTGNPDLSDQRGRSSLLSPATARRKSLPAITTPRLNRQTLAALESSADERDEKKDMARRRTAKDADLFLELARDGDDDGPSRGDRAASRLAIAVKRRSLPADPSLVSSAERRPRSSGNSLNTAAPPVSRLGVLSDLQRQNDRYRGSSRGTRFTPDDGASVSGRSIVNRTPRYPAAQDRSAMSAGLSDRIRSPELPLFGRRRPSFGSTAHNSYNKGRQSQLSGGKAQDSQDESPGDSSDPKHSQPDSASVDSQTADTVWDELDDLKSRIKKLELTGKLPPTSAALVSGDSSERPRTATTAPTTIDSSPKVERKPEREREREPDSEAETKETPPAPVNTVGGPSAANIHPTLHSALAKARPLLTGTLYHALEATASDALQLAAMTGSAGPQGTTFSAASIINGVTVSDRQVRRKADAMCRNLTDLCLALCDGKNDAASATASPITLEPVRSSPTIRYARSSVGGPTENFSRAGARPMSRLEARRTSILGTAQRSTSLGISSPRQSADDISASEQEASPAQLQPPRELRRVGRASSRLLTVRPVRCDDVSGDEDPTIRPPSRAMTDVGKLRGNSTTKRDYSSASQVGSPGLRETLAARRANSGAYDNNRELPRVASLSSDIGRRRWVKESTPPVVEEEASEATEFHGSGYQSPPQAKRRITSFGPFGPRRAATLEVPSRHASLNASRRHVVVE